jgi:hypothetical protein
MSPTMPRAGGSVDPDPKFGLLNRIGSAATYSTLFLRKTVAGKRVAEVRSIDVSDGVLAEISNCRCIAISLRCVSMSQKRRIKNSKARLKPTQTRLLASRTPLHLSVRWR